jgi:hypothetical protein
MMGLVIVIGFVGVSTLALCFTLGRFDRAAVEQDWEMTIGPRAQAHLDALVSSCALDRGMADDATTGARFAFWRGDAGEAGRLMDLAFRILVGATADRLTRLRGVRVCARLASALTPLPSLLPRGFQLRQIRTLAGLGDLVQHFLVSSRERFVVRAHVLSLGFWLVLRALRRRRAATDVGVALKRFDEAKGDWKTLDVEHVELVRVLVFSVAALRRALLIPHF